ncbi:MAG: acyltransferase family protein [Lachnospiraceae bacterium]|nr:acyltransferase family protein [Lachnospiraceae bacterium]
MKRKTYIDVAKGIAILLVILGHMNRFFDYDGRLNQMVYSVQLPVFLVIGGYWMRLKQEESPVQFLEKKFYRLLQPYFFYAVFSILYAWPENAEKFCFYVAGMLWGIGIRDYLPNLPIWFLPMFFVANLWFYLVLQIGRLGKKNWQKLLLEGLAVCILMAAGWKLKLKEERLPWGFELAMILQGFFFAGHLWRLAEEYLGKLHPAEPAAASKPADPGRNPEKKPEKKQCILLTALLIPAFLIWAVCVKMNGRVDINAAWFGNKGLWSFYLAALSGCYLVIFASALLSRCRPIAWILSLFGTNSMAIMAVHVPVLIWMDGVITPLMPAVIKANYMTKNLIGVTYSFVTIALLSLFAALLLKRYPREGRKQAGN